MDSPEIPARRHYSNRSKPKSYHTAQVRHYSTPAHTLNHVIPGSTDDSKEHMVQGWLNNTQALGSGLIAGGPTHHTPNGSNYLPRPQSVFPARRTSHALLLSRGSGFANSMSQPGGGRRHKRLRTSSDGRDDSSVIASREFADNPRIRSPRLNPAAEASYRERGKRRRQPGPEAAGSGAGPAPSPPAHRFEKRARHKTKSDRYDTVKKNDASTDRKRKKTQKDAAADSKKDRLKGSHLASALDVMDNFNSHSILSNRITMPPSLRPGLFDNGRVSKKPATSAPTPEGPLQ
ncbi:hypothetical protein N0V93_001331 [Gnomoniopsis smithogilvyi]|uniref:Uncharacterized protein n=1 Tax=Gnomoniopsis smithogilvyi TaxID=1191159 RepID=A0A9W8Z5P8_9PEZI|nr:hypothetical protein N0V93_001331 [Gnomoniopsis smithogilvyi]